MRSKHQSAKKKDSTYMSVVNIRIQRAFEEKIQEINQLWEAALKSMTQERLHLKQEIIKFKSSRNTLTYANDELHGNKLKKHGDDLLKLLQLRKHDKDKFDFGRLFEDKMLSGIAPINRSKDCQELPTGQTRSKRTRRESESTPIQIQPKINKIRYSFINPSTEPESVENEEKDERELKDTLSPSGQKLMVLERSNTLPVIPLVKQPQKSLQMRKGRSRKIPLKLSLPPVAELRHRHLSA
ncbi:hypothetical protein ACJMK2_030001 [Sinanodonta woodiana]|uniref:Uncharacterized protein n=1 Tax=Sinanodonta woodiana TaxID=1069815 RepID=A0ABD3XBY5_SINWO